MLPLPPTSRRRFAAYMEQVRRRDRGDRDARPDLLAPGSERAVRRRQRGFFTLFAELLRITRAHNTTLAWSLVASTLATLLALIPLSATKLIIDHVLGGQPLPQSILDKAPRGLDLTHPPTLLWTVTVGMVALSLVALVLHMWSRWQATRINKRVQVGVRRRLFHHAVRLPLHRVYELKSGGVASTLREDAGAVGDLVFAMLYNPWRAIVQLVGSLAVLAWTDWRLLLGAVILLPVVYGSIRLWVRRIRPMFRDIRATRERIDGHATEVFGGVRVVRGFGRQHGEARRFVLGNHFMARQELHIWWWNRAVDSAFAIVIPLSSAALMLYGGLRILEDARAVAQGTLSPAQAFTTGDLVMFLAYLGWLLEPLALLASSATGFQTGLAALDRVLDLLAEPLELTVRPGAQRLRPGQVRGAVSLRGVGFTYPHTDKPVLQGIDLEVAPGEMVAFVGPSGAGKTTLCNLIARFHDPTAGAVLLDGRDLRELHVESYRKLLGIVEQDIFLFDGTVAQNIAYGRRGASPDMIRAASIQANADSFISELAAGYDTVVGERGVKLSGGQRQRIAIARAILADPRLLILDEATSSLDTQSERLIQASLRELMKGRTSFVIAHRLSTITQADRIVVLEQGRIVEQGRHEELLGRFGPYQRMVDLQTRPIEAPVPPVAAPKHRHGVHA